MKLNVLKRAGFIATATLLLLGCFDDSLDKMINKETYAHQGTYVNDYDKASLVFSNGEVIVKTEAGGTVRSYKVDGDSLFIQVRNSSKETREDIVMRIHGEGELLTCSACAQYQLAPVWTLSSDL